MSPLQASIPADVLCVIFDLLRRSGHRQYNTSSFDQSLRWIPEVTHVCRFWRETALSVRFLWTDIHVDASVSWAIEFAHRSGNAPLRVFLRDTGDQPDAFYCLDSLLHKNRQRVQGIYLEDIHEEEVGGIAYAVLGNTKDHGPAFFPILDDLKLSLYHEPKEYYEDIYSYSFIFPNEMLQAPNLKRLSLQYCAFATASGTFQNLTHVSIKETSDSDFAASFLCRALLDMPNLESLDLTLVWQDFGYFRCTSGIFETQPVTLPKLRHIQINAWPTKWIIRFLQMISSGPQRTVWVSNVEVNRLEQIPWLFTCIMSHAIESSSIRRLVLSLNTMEVCVSASHGNHSLHDDIRLRVNFRHSNISRFHCNCIDPTQFLLNGLLQKMDLQDLQNLDLNTSQPLSTQLWVKFFGKLSSLASIVISSGEPQLFAALIDGLEDTLAETSVGVALPFQPLKEVRVYNEERGVYADKDMECMLKCLQKRMELGMTLKLSFIMRGSESHLFDLLSQFDAFRGVVTQMEVCTKFY